MPPKKELCTALSIRRLHACGAFTGGPAFFADGLPATGVEDFVGRAKDVADVAGVIEGVFGGRCSSANTRGFELGRPADLAIELLGVGILNTLGAGDIDAAAGAVFRLGREGNGYGRPAGTFHLFAGQFIADIGRLAAVDTSYTNRHRTNAPSRRMDFRMRKVG